MPFGDHIGEKLFVAVFDMNGLKNINDTYGHAQGDNAISLMSTAVKRAALPEELSVRAGGDEFFIIGIGDYKDSDIPARKNEFNRILKDLADASHTPYEVTASIGIVTEEVNENTNIDSVISRADEIMYEEKSRIRSLHQ
jgi:diguanylate cyclase (GGDEF)-like protein